MSRQDRRIARGREADERVAVIIAETLERVLQNSEHRLDTKASQVVKSEPNGEANALPHTTPEGGAPCASTSRT